MTITKIHTVSKEVMGKLKHKYPNDNTAVISMWDPPYYEEEWESALYKYSHHNLISLGFHDIDDEDILENSLYIVGIENA